MTRFLELGSGISCTPDVMVIPPWLRFLSIVREKEMCPNNVKHENTWFLMCLNHMLITWDICTLLTPLAPIYESLIPRSTYFFQKTASGITIYAVYEMVSQGQHKPFWEPFTFATLKQRGTSTCIVTLQFLRCTYRFLRTVKVTTIRVAKNHCLS